MTTADEQRAAELDRHLLMQVDPAKLTALRLDRSWSRSGLAIRAGLSLAAITKIENGQRTPQAGTLQKICTALGCQPAELLQDPA